MYNDSLMENNALYNEIESEYSSDLSYIDYKDFNDTEQDILDDEPEQDIPDEDELFDQLEIYPITKRKRYELSELFDKYIDNLNELTNKVNEAKSKILSKNGYIITYLKTLFDDQKDEINQKIISIATLGRVGNYMDKKEKALLDTYLNDYSLQEPIKDIIKTYGVENLDDEFIILSNDPDMFFDILDVAVNLIQKDNENYNEVDFLFDKIETD